MKSKTIILSSEEGTNKTGRGILTIYSEDNLLKCRLRLYNVEKLNKFCKLGIYHNKQVYSANLIERNGTYFSSLVGDFDINNDFYTAIINTQLNNSVIVAGGTYAGHFFNENAVFSEIEPTQNKTDLITPIVSKEELKECDNNCDKCANCVYKEYFYANNSNLPNLNAETPEDLINNKAINNEFNNPPNTQEINENKYTTLKENSINKLENLPNEEINNSNINKELKKDELNSLEHNQLLNSLQQQFTTLFNNYPQNEELNNLIENSKFVTINENNNSYSIGAIYEQENLKYLCYAVKGLYNSSPPTEIGDHFQWVPLDSKDPLTDGYFVVFQDSKDFKILDI